MKYALLLVSLGALACSAQTAEPPGQSFQTDDASYALGEHHDEDGALVNVEVVYDASSSYLTPQTPNTTWIVDRALAHTQEGPLLLSEVAAVELYVRECETGEWINAKKTPFAPDSELLLGVFDGEYLLGHYYGNTETNALLDGQFDCPTDPASFANVTVDGQQQQVQRVGEVEFAYVVEHRQ
jgi:hypothetical protein